MTVKYKTISSNTPEDLDRQVNDYLVREVKEDGYLCKWQPYGPQTVTLKGTSMATLVYTQAMTLMRVCFDESYFPGVGLEERETTSSKTEGLTISSFLESHKVGETKLRADPILNFVLS